MTGSFALSLIGARAKKLADDTARKTQAIYEVVITKQKQTSQTCMCKIVYFIFTD